MKKTKFCIVFGIFLFFVAHHMRIDKRNPHHYSKIMYIVASACFGYGVRSAFYRKKPRSNKPKESQDEEYDT